MITSRTINSRIDQCKLELQKLQIFHDAMVKDFQEKVSANQSRFAQLTGAITELTELLKYEPTTDNGSSDSGTEPGASTDRILNPGDSPRDYLGAPMVHRKLDPPYTSTSKINIGDNPPDPGDNLGTPEFHGR